MQGYVCCRSKEKQTPIFCRNEDVTFGQALKGGYSTRKWSRQSS
jgi:hypothetical protein